MFTEMFAVTLKGQINVFSTLSKLNYKNYIIMKWNGNFWVSNVNWGDSLFF